eukprot:COSAG02_NODE_5153_length_4586_cov_4.246490_3_plen_103_part_00
MLVCATIVCSALCFDEDDKRMICHEILNKFGYRCVLPLCHSLPMQGEYRTFTARKWIQATFLESNDFLCPRANVLVFSCFYTRNLQVFTTELRLRLLLRPMR